MWKNWVAVSPILFCKLFTLLLLLCLKQITGLALRQQVMRSVTVLCSPLTHTDWTIIAHWLKNCWKLTWQDPPGTKFHQIIKIWLIWITESDIYLWIGWKIPRPDPMRPNLDHFYIFHSGYNIVMMGNHAASLARNSLLRHILRILQLKIIITAYSQRSSDTHHSSMELTCYLFS